MKRRLSGSYEGRLRPLAPSAMHEHCDRRRPPVPVLAALFILFCAISLPASADGTAREVIQRNELRCGVSEGIPGFSQRDASGLWTGLDVDLCRAIAAAVLGDPMRVRFVPLKASHRFPALQARRVDVLARNTTWTMTREVLLKMSFPGVWFYDGQAFMVSASAGVTSVSGLDGAAICVEQGTTHEANLLRHFAARGLKAEAVVIDSAGEAAAALYAGRCRAYSSDAAQLAALRLQAPGGPQGFVILPERISKEPLGPVVRGDDQEWASLVRWVLYALIVAEERGITRANVESAVNATLALLNPTPRARADWDYAARELGLRPDWALQAIRAAGNYGEIFERNLGAASALRLERGLNALWTQGGLMYAPPLN